MPASDKPHYRLTVTIRAFSESGYIATAEEHLTVSGTPVAIKAVTDQWGALEPVASTVLIDAMSAGLDDEGEG